MPLDRNIVTVTDFFRRPLSLSTTPEGGTGWTIADTSAAGTPTYAVQDEGNLLLQMDATSEAQIVTLYHNDIKTYDIDKLKYVEWVCEVSGIDSVTTAVWGIASERNDTDDTVAEAAWFRMEGSVSTSNVVVESDDGTNNNDDVATGQTLAAVAKRFVVDFTQGTADVRFFMGNADSDLRRVADGTTFDMSNYALHLQPYVQIQKASGTGTPGITIHKFEIQYQADAP
jgi:hypothetical protein